MPPGSVHLVRIAGIVDAALERVRPDAWISLGLAPGSSVIAVERIAASVRDVPIPDNDGNQPIDEPVYPGGPAGRMATLPIKSVTRAVREAFRRRSRTRRPPISATR